MDGNLLLIFLSDQQFHIITYVINLGVK